MNNGGRMAGNKNPESDNAPAAFVWPEEAVDELRGLAENFPKDLREGFVNVFLKGQPDGKLDEFLGEHPDMERHLLDALQLEGEVTLGHSRGVLAEVANSLSSPRLMHAPASKQAIYAMAREVARPINALALAPAREEALKALKEELQPQAAAMLSSLAHDE
jgi:hypothetical protein